ncbi:MAG: hypothetical protein U0232_14245 [Thermomicrobiales bacterium]
MVAPPAAPVPATPLAHPEPLAYFSHLRERFGQVAAAVGGATERTYLVGGCGLRLRFAGPALVPLLTPALAPLACPPDALPPGASLTVELWDSASTGSAPPPPGWSVADRQPRGEVRGYDAPDSRIRAAYHDDHGAISLLDTATGTAIFYARDARGIAPYETASPLRVILHWWLAAHARRFIHGGAVGTSEGGVIVVGRGGSGKSTSCLACLAAPESGLRYASDDYALLEEGPEPRVHSLYASAKLRTDQFWRVPRLADLATRPDGADDAKSILLLHNRFPERLIASFPLRAVLVPRIVGGSATRLRPTSPGIALTALAPSTIFQLAGADGAALRAMRGVVEQVPSYLLELGEETAQIPVLIAALLAGKQV